MPGPQWRCFMADEQNPSPSPPPHVPWSARLLNLGAQLAFGLLVGVFLIVVLMAAGTSPRVAGGTAVAAALVAAIVARGLIRWPLPKEAFARETRLPPGVRA